MNGADLERLPGWEAALAAHTDAMRAATYKMGTLDCGKAAALAVKAVTGADVWPISFGAYKTERGLAKALAAQGWQSLDDGVTAALGDPIAPLAAHSGDVVSDGAALGWMTPSGPVALSDTGFAALHPASIVRAWPAGRAHG